MKRKEARRRILLKLFKFVSQRKLSSGNFQFCYLIYYGKDFPTPIENCVRYHDFSVKVKGKIVLIKETELHACMAKIVDFVRST